MTCWKCGAETAEGVIECAGCCTTKTTFSCGPPTRKIDMNKVHTLDHLKQILAVFGFQVLIGSPAEEALREFLAD